MEQPKSINIFSNGSALIFGYDGQQMGELQQMDWLSVYLKALQDKGVDIFNVEIWTKVNGLDRYVKPQLEEGGRIGYTFIPF